MHRDSLAKYFWYILVAFFFYFFLSLIYLFIFQYLLAFKTDVKTKIQWHVKNPKWKICHVLNFYLFQEEEETKPRLARNDPKEIMAYYQNFYNGKIKEGQYAKKP